MSRISVGHFIIAGLLFWGLPAVIVAGPWAIVYTVCAVIPMLWLCGHPEQAPAVPERRMSTVACAVLASFSLMYLLLDATLGRQLLQTNMFLHHGAGLDQEIEQLNAKMSQAGGIASIFGYIFTLLPVALIDATANTSRFSRWILWAVALLLLFYETGAGRGFVLMCVAAVFLGRTSDWRRITIGVVVAIGVFSAASVFRGDATHAGLSPLLVGIASPFVNLALMLKSECGTAPWYSFVLEFLKKFVPGFIIPKKVFSFNMEMSLCVYPTVDKTVASVSVFTWLGEIFYYTPSMVTAVLAGGILGFLARAVDRSFVRNRLYSARLLAGLLCFYLPRSRTQDIFTFLIAQLLFLAMVWPQLRNLPRTLHRFLPEVHAPVFGQESKQEPM
jgi:hypothetical protein